MSLLADGYSTATASPSYIANQPLWYAPGTEVQYSDLALNRYSNWPSTVSLYRKLLTGSTLAVFSLNVVSSGVSRTVDYVLKNQSYLGEYIYDGKTEKNGIQVNIQPLISRRL